MPISGRVRRGAKWAATRRKASLGSSTRLNAEVVFVRVAASARRFRDRRMTAPPIGLSPADLMPAKKAIDPGPAFESDCARSISRVSLPSTWPSSHSARAATRIAITESFPVSVENQRSHLEAIDKRGPRYAAAAAVLAQFRGL